MRTLRETYIDLSYMGSRKSQDLLSKLGAWGTWERVKGEGRDRDGSREKGSSMKIKKNASMADEVDKNDSHYPRALHKLQLLR